MSEEETKSAIEETQERPIDTIEQIAETIRLREPRPMHQQLIVSFSTIFGPIMLIVMIFFPSLFDFLPISGYNIFVPITILFFGTSILSAKRYN